MGSQRVGHDLVTEQQQQQVFSYANIAVPENTLWELLSYSFIDYTGLGKPDLISNTLLKLSFKVIISYQILKCWDEVAYL